MSLEGTKLRAVENQWCVAEMEAEEEFVGVLWSKQDTLFLSVAGLYFVAGRSVITVDSVVGTLDFYLEMVTNI